jgi:nitric oxide dioxygenase
VGDTIDIGPPCGEFTRDVSEATKTDRPIVLLSGGIGITPVLSMLKALVRAEVRTPIHFFHAAQSGDHHAFAEEVRETIGDAKNVVTHVRYNAPNETDLESNRCDSVGFIDDAFLDAHLPKEPAEFYFCGPKPFMVNLYAALKRRGVPEAQIHFEFFGPKQAMTQAA